MIWLYTVAKPDPGIRDFAPQIFSLPQGAYNLPVFDHPEQPLFDALYQLGVRQLIHDGSRQEIRCASGYLYAQSAALGKIIPEKEILIIKH